MKEKAKLLVIGNEENSLFYTTKRLMKKTKYVITKLPTMNKLLNNKFKQKLLEDHIISSKYDAVVCVCNPDDIEDMIAFLTFTSYLCKSLYFHTYSENIPKKVIKYHENTIVEVFPYIKPLTKINKKNKESAYDYLKIKYPKTLNDRIELVSSTFNQNNIINPHYLATKSIANQTISSSEIQKAMDKCLVLTAEFLCGKYYEICFKNLF